MRASTSSIGRARAAACLLALLWIAALAAGCKGAAHEVTERRMPIRIGSTTIDMVVHETGAPGLNTVNLHDDENTSVEAALAVIRQRGGRVIELQHTGERNISFTLADTVYTFDPNRIFTDAGAAATLRRLGPYSEAALQAVRAFADTLLSQVVLDEAAAVVALHNNTEGNYSTLSYASGGAYAADAQFVHLAADQHPDNFFFVTDLTLYNEIRQGGFNVVLQDNTAATDDGSLSVYCGQRGIAYVNVEARHGHYEEQVQMIEFLNRLL